MGRPPGLGPLPADIGQRTTRGRAAIGPPRRPRHWPASASADATDDSPATAAAPNTTLSRFWGWRPAPTAARLRFRGYRPLSGNPLLGSDSVNQQPQSPSADHTASGGHWTTATPDAPGCRCAPNWPKGCSHQRLDGCTRDSLWFGYSQQSYWQLFASPASRGRFAPPTTARTPLRLPPMRLALGLALALAKRHRPGAPVNGQSLPLSRSWNRVPDDRPGAGRPLALNARIWKAPARKRRERRQPRHQ